MGPVVEGMDAVQVDVVGCSQVRVMLDLYDAEISLGVLVQGLGLMGPPSVALDSEFLLPVH